MKKEKAVLAWSESPEIIKFGPGIAIADVAIDKDYTLTMYCAADQAHRVPGVLAALFAQPTFSAEDVEAAYVRGTHMARKLLRLQLGLATEEDLKEKT
jgi:hypothetical protein